MARWKRLFTAWQGGQKERGLPPPPDLAQPMRVDGGREKMIEVVTSPDGRHRVGITKASGLYRIYAETWAPDWDSLGVATWLSSGHLGSFADTLERARALARESLAALGGPAAADHLE